MQGFATERWRQFRRRRQISVLRRNPAGSCFGYRAGIEVDAMGLCPVEMREPLEKQTRVASDVEMMQAGE